MFRKSASFILVLSCLLLIVACSNKEKGTEKTSTTPAPAPAATPAPATTEKAEPPADSKSDVKDIDVQVSDAQLPRDVPAYPGAQLADKRKTADITKFVFNSTDNPVKIKEYYLNELKKLQWQQQYSSNSTELAFSKDVRVIKITPIPLGNQGTQINIFTSLPQQQGSAQPETLQAKSEKLAGNIGDSLKYFDEIPPDVPVYPNGEPKDTTNLAMVRKWREFKVNDPVNKIASWYEDKMKTNGWARYHDTSEGGDSMVIYNKILPDGGNRYVGIRVNEMKSYRNLTVILYPIGIFLPKLKSPTQLAAENPEIIKQGLEEKKKMDALLEKAKQEEAAKQKKQ